MAKKQPGRQGRVIRRKSTPEELDHLESAWAEEEAGMAENRQLGRELRDRKKATAVVREALDAIQRVREAQQITLEQLGQRAGMTRGNLSRLLNNPEPNVQIETLQRIANVLGQEVHIEIREISVGKASPEPTVTR